MELEKIKELLKSEPSYRLKQVEKALYKGLIGSRNDAAVLPVKLREKLEREIPIFSYYLKRTSKPIKNSGASRAGRTVKNIVFMGMGEPFLNYDNVIKAIRFLNDTDEFDIEARHISVSAAGIPEKIKEFSNENLQVNLAVSLNSPNDKRGMRRAWLQKTSDCGINYYDTINHKKKKDGYS